MDPVAIDDPFPHTEDEQVDLCKYQLQNHIIGTWLNAIREAMAQDPLCNYTSQDTCDGKDESQWQMVGRILYRRGKGDIDCIYIPITAHRNGLNIRVEIMCLTYQELAYFGPNKYYQDAEVYFF
jgi:hypothetical protein